LPDETKTIVTAKTKFFLIYERGIRLKKKFTQFSEENIFEITQAYHNWQTDLSIYKKRS
jgi:type I restriction enzyme M protein